MASEQARFLFQDPNSLVTVLAIVWVILVPILFVAVWAGMRMPGARSRFLILLVSGAVCAVPPIGALQVARGVTLSPSWSLRSRAWWASRRGGAGSSP
jgi:hypothetical protein